MPYVRRNTDGSLLSLTQEADPLHQEFLPATSPAIIAFLTQEGSGDLSKSVLAESDKDLARVTEDLIYLLISKQLILFTDLPSAVQQKLLSREKLRANLQGVVVDFLDDSESI